MRGPVTPYLTFYGQAHEAADYYCRVFGLVNKGMMTYRESDYPTETDMEHLIMHCLLQREDFRLMMADTAETDSAQPNSNVSLMVECEDEDEAERIYKDLSEEGEVLMELQDTFWGAKYGKVKDKFGIIWDLNAE